MPLPPSTPSICLGVDPGSLACGWAVVARLGSRMELVEAGVIRSARGAAFSDRIQGIHLKLSEVIAAHHPHFMAVESPFVEKHRATAIKHCGSRTSCPSARDPMPRCSRAPKPGKKRG